MIESDKATNSFCSLVRSSRSHIAQSHALVLATLSLVIFALGCATDPNTRFIDQPISITFIETSDINGAIIPYDYANAMPLKSSLAQVAALVSGERAAKSELVLLDGGDSLQGQASMYYHNFEKPLAPNAWAEALNYIGYDAIGIGERDIATGRAVYDKFFREVKATPICANALKEDGTPYFSPYKIIVRQGIRIAILGLVTPKIPGAVPIQSWSGLVFEDMVVSAKRWIPIIREKEKPDIIVGLFHSGVDYSKGGLTRDTPNNENASQLVVEQVPGFDFIFAGHDHQGWDGKGWIPLKQAKAEIKDPTGKTVFIFGARDGAQKIPVVNLRMLWDDELKQWIKIIRGGLVDLTETSPDPIFIGLFKNRQSEFENWLERPIGILQNPIDSKESLFEDSAFIDLIHRIRLELCADPSTGLKKAEISFVAPPATLTTLAASAGGRIYPRDLLKLYAHDSLLCTMQLSGKQVRDYLEFSYGNWFEALPNEGRHLIAFQKNKEGKLVFDVASQIPKPAIAVENFDSAAGIIYGVDLSKPLGVRVKIHSMADGSAFDPATVYNVALDSNRALGAGGHLEKGAKINKTDIQSMKFVTSATTKDFRFFLIKWFEKQKGPIEAERQLNWGIMPEDSAAIGKGTDSALLFPSLP